MIGNEVNEPRVGEDAKRRVQTLGKAIFLVLLVTAQTSWVHAEPSLTLQYDDGGAESFWSDYYPNGIAVMFTPPASKWKITSILIYGFIIDRGEKPFLIEVRDSDFNFVFRAYYSSGYFKNNTLNWSRISLPSIIVKGDFYICVYPMLEPNETQLWLAIDNDTVSNRSFLADCYRQETRKYYGGNVMIRVEGEEAIDFIKIIPHSIFIEEALRLLFRVVAPSNVTEVKAMLQTEALMEDCSVICKDGLYEVIIDWSKLFGLKEPARLTLSAKVSETMASLTVKLDENLLSTYFQLRDENTLLMAMLNSSKPEQEALKHKLANEEADIVALRSLLDMYEKKWLDEAKKNERLSEELNTLRLLTALLVISTFSLLIMMLRKRPLIGLTSGRASKGGEQRCLGGH
ncbi:MAG: hypothetical protein ACP5PQ_01335 [Thermoproteota archaeon]